MACAMRWCWPSKGVSGTVSNPSTTPAISLTLGAITPSSVAASGAVTGSNLSGNNTGDQTITLTGSGLDTSTDVVFRVTDSAGNVNDEIVQRILAFAKQSARNLEDHELERLVAGG